MWIVSKMMTSSRAIESFWETGRALFGGSREVDPDAEKRLQRLASRRLDVLENWLQENGRLRRAQLMRTPWDGKVRDGTPRVNLRLHVNQK